MLYTYLIVRYLLSVINYVPTYEKNRGNLPARERLVKFSVIVMHTRNTYNSNGIIRGSDVTTEIKHSLYTYVMYNTHTYNTEFFASLGR